MNKNDRIRAERAMNRYYDLWVTINLIMLHLDDMRRNDPVLDEYFNDLYRRLDSLDISIGSLM